MSNKTYSAVKQDVLANTGEDQKLQEVIGLVSERLIQYIWHKQMLRSPLLSLDGQTIEVIQPGFWNKEAGPDFTRAVLRIDGVEFTGDVEIHIKAEDWMGHGHDLDRRYDGVILHVALIKGVRDYFTKTTENRLVPMVLIAQQLVSPLIDIYDDFDDSGFTDEVKVIPGRCSLPMAGMATQDINDILEVAGTERFILKARRLNRMLNRAGKTQALWECLLEALGYKSNKTAFKSLARFAPHHELENLPISHRHALLMGVAGFLPAGTLDTIPSANRSYVKDLWDVWWKYRGGYEDKMISLKSWKLSGLRPINHPQRRISAAAKLVPVVERILKELGRREGVFSLDKIKQPTLEDEFWSYHYTFTSAPSPKALAIIGPGRWRDIQINVLLPMAYAIAETDKRRDEVIQSLKGLPAGEVNTVVRTASYRLRVPPRCLNKAIRQQGLHQVFHDFCLTDKTGCEKCLFPELIKRWTQTNVREGGIG
ncbi:MAG: DUF2851 family protein [Verrucomicrobiota bacterium]|nr:DUF2851 family protein [Verrucomicrobiota bacterium]